MLQKWRATVARNWLYMSAATLLSVLLWVAVNANTIDQDNFLVDLVIHNLDLRYVLTDREPERGTVSVTFTGRAGVLALSAARSQLVVDIRTVDSTVVEIALEPRMVKGPGGRELPEDVRAVRVNPNRLRLTFELRGEKVVPVVPQVNYNLAEGYTLADSVRALPAAVAVQGPESLVADIDSVFTVPVRRDRLRESIRMNVGLANPDASGLVELSLSSVQVTIPVEASGERVFPGIPVTVGGVEVEGVRVEPSLVDVRLVGPRSVVEAVRPEELSPSVELSGPDDVGARLPIILGAPKPFVKVLLEPDSALIVRFRGSR